MKSARLGRVCWLALVSLVLSAALAAAADAPGPAPAKRPDPWWPLRRLVGAWDGTAQGKPGAGQVQREYRFVLRDRFIEVTNVSTYAPTEKRPQGERHEDRGIFSYDRAQKKHVLRQFHVEGFVNQYVLESISEDGNTLVFVTTAIENLPAGWRARETYRFAGENEFTERFDLAEPGQEFEPYSETHFTRRP